MEHMVFSLMGITVVMDRFMDNLYKISIHNSKGLLQLEAVAFKDVWDMKEIQKYILRKVEEFV